MDRSWPLLLGAIATFAVAITLAVTPNPHRWTSWYVLLLLALAVGSVAAAFFPQAQRGLPFIGAGIAAELNTADTYETVPLREPPNAIGFFTHLHIRAKRAAAKQCECWVVGVAQRSSTGVVPCGQFRSRTRLHWANEALDVFEKDIARGHQERVDFVHGVSPAPGVAALFCEDKPGSQTAFPAGEYEAQIELVARNARRKRVTVAFRIRDWNNIHIETVD